MTDKKYLDIPAHATKNSETLSKYIKDNIHKAKTKAQRKAEFLSYKRRMTKLYK